MPRFESYDGTALHYDDTGAGDVPVLCLSGLTRNGSDFDYVMPHIGEHRVIRLDYRGRGRSDWADSSTYNVPSEGQDVLALLDHLGLERVAILGTSRGGIISMLLATLAHERLMGVCLVDIGPEIDPRGLEAIMGYLGRNPAQKSYEEAAEMRASLMAGFEGVPRSRWDEEVRKHYVEENGGLVINYDPRLRDAVLANGAKPGADAWPMFDAMEGLPTAVIRGANSDILSRATVARMKARRPDLIAAEVPGRGHVPFLDERESLDAIGEWLERMG